MNNSYVVLGQIAVVDDTTANLHLLANLLENANYDVRPFPRGKLALEGIAYSLPDLILLDIQMPEMNGYEVCEKLKTQELTRSIPVIFISALNETIDKVKAFQVGGVDYINKPFHEQEVLARVATHLELYQVKKKLQKINFIQAQQLAEQNAQLIELNESLEEKVKQRTRELEAAQQQIISQEKLASLGALTAGVAHELRNPLNFVTNYAESSVEIGTELMEEFSGEQPPNQENWEHVQETITDLKENAAAIYKHGQRAESIIHNMMQHSRRDDNSPQLTEINKLLDEARQLAYHSRRSHDTSFNITFTTEYDESIGELEVFSASLNRAFINIIDNGCYAAWQKYVANGQKTSPQLWITTKNLEKEIEVHIRDNGIGIPDEVVEKIFEPFFTTKPTGEGTGLGLSLTHEIIVGQHGGTLQVKTELGSFTEFILALPSQ